VEGGPQTPPPSGGPPPEGQPSEEELRARLEEELRKVRVEDLLLQSVASLVNLTARRIAKEDERDLEQAKVGIDAVRALVDLLDPEPQAQVKNALSELQVLYAQQSQGGAADTSPEPGGEGGEGAAGEPQRPQPQRPSGLWTPPGTSSS
jgi:hypothetical protein